MSTSDSRNKRRFIVNVTTRGTRAHNFVRNLSVVERVVRSVISGVSLSSVRTIISISLDLGRLIDRGNAFDVAPSLG